MTLWTRFRVLRSALATTARPSLVVVSHTDHMTKSEPITVRLSSELDRWVTDEARRTRRPKGTVVEALAEEALKARRFPGIAFRGDDWDRRAWMTGCALDVWEIVRAFQECGSVDGLAGQGSLSERQINMALAYYEHYPEEIDTRLGRDRRQLDDLRAAYPGVAVIEL
jgi:hypothetical protein